MEIKIIFVGQLDKDLVIIEEKYKQNIEKWAELDLINLKDNALSKGVTSDEAQLKQGKAITEYLDGRYLLISVSPKGEAINSDQLKEIFLENKEKYGGKVIFMIGGKLGLPEAILKKADINLSMSKLEAIPSLNKVVLMAEIEKILNLIYK